MERFGFGAYYGRGYGGNNGKELHWGTEKSLAEDDYFQWWKEAQRPKTGHGKTDTFSQWPTGEVCVSVCVYMLSVHAHVCVSLSPCLCTYVYEHMFCLCMILHVWECVCACWCTSVSLCMWLCAGSCVYVMWACLCMYGCTCTVENPAGNIPVDAVGKCLFTLSLQWVETWKSMNGYV